VAGFVGAPGATAHVVAAAAAAAEVRGRLVQTWQLRLWRS
jgi:hypothetical protein